MPGSGPRKKICGAKNRQGNPCQRYAMANGRCYKHGGKSLAGIASPTWKHGRYSDYMPQGLGELAKLSAADPTLFDLTELIGVYDARIKNALSELETGGGMERFLALQTAWQEFRAARDEKNSAAYFAAEARIDALLQAAAHDIWLWKDIDVAAKNLKLLMESERKRQIEAHMLVPAIKATDVVRQVVIAVRQEVSDQATLSRIQARVTDILGSQPAILEGATHGE